MDTEKQLVNALVGLGSTIAEAMDEVQGFVPCGHPALVVVGAVTAIADGADNQTLAEQVEAVSGFIDHVAEHRGVAACHGLDVELTGSKAELFDEIAAVAALMKTVGVANAQVNEWVYRSLAAIGRDGDAVTGQLDRAAAIRALLR